MQNMQQCTINGILFWNKLSAVIISRNVNFRHSSRLARSGIEDVCELALELRLDNVAAQNSGCKVPGLAHLSHTHDVGILRFI